MEDREETIECDIAELKKQLSFLENITKKKLDYIDLKTIEDTLKVLASSEEIKYYY